MHSVDILFYCNANSQVGFGHLRRCLFLAKELQTNEIDVAFAGELNADAAKLVREEMSSVSYHDETGTVAAGVAVIDFMFDPQDMEAYDRSLIARVADRADTSILLTSAATVPAELPVDVVVGHLLEAYQETSFELKTGLKYAPVAPEFEEYRSEKPEVSGQIRRVFIGFGNWDDPQGVISVLRGLHDYGYRNRIDILLPAALLSYIDQFEDTAHALEVEFHHRVPSVAALLTHADVAFGSYGNMTYEMLALGVPSVVFAVKDFMVEYTRQLQDRELLMFGGEVPEVTPADIRHVVETLTESRRRLLSRRSLEAVDASGLHRVGEVIRDRLPQ